LALRRPPPKADRLVAEPDTAVNLADPDVAALISHLLAAARRLGRPVEK
jgi:hypothetical protein